MEQPKIDDPRMAREVAVGVGLLALLVMLLCLAAARRFVVNAEAVEYDQPAARVSRPLLATPSQPSNESTNSRFEIADRDSQSKPESETGDRQADEVPSDEAAEAKAADRNADAADIAQFGPLQAVEPAGRAWQVAQLGYVAPLDADLLSEPVDRPAATQPLRGPADRAADEKPAPAADGGPTQDGPADEAPPGMQRVGADDSWWTISVRAYGTGQYFRALYEHNRDRVPDGVLPVGQLIETPPIPELRRLYPHAVPPDDRSAIELRDDDPVRRDQAYVVQPGDTLFDIARRQLGQAARYVEILRLNPHLPPDASQPLPAGMRLMLPSP